VIDLVGKDSKLPLKSLSIHDGDTITILPYRSPAQGILNHPSLDVDDAAQVAATSTQIDQAITDLCGGTLPPQRRRRRHRVPTNPNLDGADAVRALMTGNFEEFQNYFQNMSLISSEEDIDMGSALAGISAAGMGGGSGGASAEERLTSMLGALNSIQSIISTTAPNTNNNNHVAVMSDEEEDEDGDEDEDEDEEEEEALQQGMPADVADMISRVYAALGAGTNPLVTGLGSGGGGGGGGINIVRPPLPNEANDRLVNQLIEMGFNRELATNALILNYNRVDPAVEWLLNRMVEPEAALTASSRLIEERREGERRRREEVNIGNDNNEQQQERDEEGEGDEEREEEHSNAAVGGVDTNQGIPSPASPASSSTTPTATITPPPQVPSPSEQQQQQQQLQGHYEDEISQLIAMGFDSELARRAMVEFGSLNVAVNALLSGSYSG
jgi:hypothetical protein